MLQRLPTALSQVKSGNTSENLLNKVTQIIYSLYRAKENNNIMNYNHITIQQYNQFNKVIIQK